MMNVLETEWWSLALPPEWWADTDEESILIADRDEVGCIEISTLHKEQGDFDAEQVRRIAGEESAGTEDWRKVDLGDFRGFSGSFMEEGVAIREWYVSHGPLLLFITYSCDAENRGMDDAAVDELLDTLMVQQPSET